MVIITPSVFQPVLTRLPVHVPLALMFGKIDFFWSAVHISICLHLCELHICISCPIPIVVSTLRVSMPQKDRAYNCIKSRPLGKYRIVILRRKKRWRLVHLPMARSARYLYNNAHEHVLKSKPRLHNVLSTESHIVKHLLAFFVPYRLC